VKAITPLLPPGDADEGSVSVDGYQTGLMAIAPAGVFVPLLTFEPSAFIT